MYVHIYLWIVFGSLPPNNLVRVASLEDTCAKRKAPTSNGKTGD